MFNDENGKLSAARILLFFLFIVISVVVLKDTFSPPEVVAPPYTFLSTLVGTLAAWAGIPRIVANNR